jgi:ribonuclease P protein component
VKKEGLSRKERLTKEKDFERVFKKGKKVWIGRVALMFYLENGLPYSRLGVAVSKKLRKAVKRNRAKRLIKEVFRRNKHLFPKGSDIIIIPHPGIVELDYWRVLKEFENSLYGERGGKEPDN